MAADSLDATKLRVLREAVRHNVEAPRRVRPERAPGSTPALPLGMAGCLLIASLVYLSLPAKVGSPITAHAEAAPAGRRAAPSEAAQAAPQRLARAVLPLPIKRIVLDPGHGGAQSGALAESGASEKEITLDLALRLRRLLQDASFEVLLTREADVTMSLEQRVAFANARRADVFVSIHVNWISRRGVRPVETYHVGPTDDPAVLKLAGAENRESGYSLGAYRRLLEKIYIDERRDESRALARTINAELYRALSAVNPGLENRGVKMAPFAVLVGTEMPAILVEVSCLSNEEEAELLTTDDYRARIAAALLRGIRSYSRDLDGVAKKEG
jgi:N-acetylmuramoyl-L-alanine amidase